MHRRIRAAVACLALVAGGCSTAVSTPSPIVSQQGTASASAAPSPSVGTTPLATFPRNPAPIVEGQAYNQTIDPAMFVDRVDNPFLPWIVGSRFIFDGTEHVEVNVLPDTKMILGVKTTVVHDQVFSGKEVTEDTLDWYAQDRQGNVWYFGEQTAEYKNGKVASTEGSWVGGVDGAQPGIVMLAQPEVGDSYRQEYKKGEAEDLAAVTAVTGSISSKAGSWSGADVLVTEEWTPLEPGVREQKTYARGVGNVEAHLLKGGKEETSLTSVTIGASAALVTAGLPTADGPFALLLLLGLFAISTVTRTAHPGVRSRPSRRHTTPTG
jgi:hypothetical protein